MRTKIFKVAFEVLPKEMYLKMESSVQCHSNETYTFMCRAVLGSAKSALKFKYEIEIG